MSKPKFDGWVIVKADGKLLRYGREFNDSGVLTEAGMPSLFRTAAHAKQHLRKNESVKKARIVIFK